MYAKKVEVPSFVLFLYKVLGTFIICFRSNEKTRVSNTDFPITLCQTNLSFANINVMHLSIQNSSFVNNL